MSHNVEFIRRSLLPAYMDELRAANARGQESRANDIKSEIERLRKIVGPDDRTDVSATAAVTRDAVAKPPRRR